MYLNMKTSIKGTVLKYDNFNWRDCTWIWKLQLKGMYLNMTLQLKGMYLIGQLQLKGMYLNMLTSIKGMYLNMTT